MIKKEKYITLLAAACIRLLSIHASAQHPLVLNPESYKTYIERFNRDDKERYKGNFPNHAAWSFIKENIPLLDCPDKDIELSYYFRWWTYRKHIKQTTDGFVVTEFLPQVSWSGKHNAISCAAAHHFYEGRWIRDKQYLHDNAVFWLRKGGDLRSYSSWFADALWANYEVGQDSTFIRGLLPDLVANYKGWETGRMLQDKYFIGKNTDGLFSTIDDRDGMEMSIGKHGKRPSINAYMYGDARAIARIARLAGNAAVEGTFTQKADSLRSLVLNKLWDAKDPFFKILPYGGTELVNVKELIGYTPWYFNLPPPGKGYEEAWVHLKSQQGFSAPYGLTTAEQSHPGFTLSYTGHECQWNGPSWPFATSATLTALANVLNNYPQTVVQRSDYFNQLTIYARSQRRIDRDGRLLPWIDEVLNPYTGDWISRTILEDLKWPGDKGGVERGKDYNHSTFCDLVITGLIGLRPRSGNVVVVNPLVPGNTWDWFCLDNVAYHGRILTIVYDKFGTKYNKGKGLMCFADGKLMARANNIEKISFVLQ